MLTTTQLRDSLHYLDASDLTERGWWYRDEDGVLDIVDGVPLSADADLDVVLGHAIARLRARGVEVAS